MNQSIGFFDVDSRELAPGGGGLVLRPRMKPLEPSLERLYRLADAGDIMLLFTVCCSGAAPTPGSLPDVLHVPLTADESGWEKEIGGYRTIHLEKSSHGCPRINFEKKAYDMFQDNGNIVPVLRLLGIPRWVVFGNGLDLCVNAAVRGIMDAGFETILLTDVLVSSATGYGECGTEENRLRTIAALRGLGARIMTLDDFAKELAV